LGGKGGSPTPRRSRLSPCGEEKKEEWRSYVHGKQPDWGFDVFKVVDRSGREIWETGGDEPIPIRNSLIWDLGKYKALGEKKKKKKSQRNSIPQPLSKPEKVASISVKN